MSREVVIGLGAAIGGAVAWWGAVTLCEVMASRAKADGVEDWQDLFWPRMLARLDSARHARARAVIEERTAPPSS